MSFLTSKQVFDEIFGQNFSKPDLEKQESGTPASECEQEVQAEESCIPDKAGSSQNAEPSSEEKADAESVETAMGQFLEGLAGYLSGQPGPLPKILGAYIRGGGPLMVFSCREDVCASIVAELYTQQIPYALISSPDGQYGFLVRAEDQQKTENVQKAVLEMLSRRCEILTGDDIKRKAAASPDKSCISLCGLTLGQEEIFRKKFAQLQENAELGVDRMKDGTYMVTLPTKDCIRTDNPDTADLCRAWLEMILSCGGPNGNRNQALAEYAFDLSCRLAKDFREPGVSLNRTPLWVVGNSQQYMRISANGFEYGRGQNRDQKVVLKPVARIDITNPSYRRLLVSYLSRIPFAVTTYDQNEMMAHLKKKKEAERSRDLLDTAPDARQVIMERGEREMAHKIDQLIKNKIRHDPVMIETKHYSEKFIHYSEELTSFMTSLTDELFPEGYSKEDIAALNATMSRYGLDGEMYRETLPEIHSVEIIEITDTIERIADIGEALEKEELARQEEARNRAAERSSVHSMTSRKRIRQAPPREDGRGRSDQSGRDIGGRD